VLRLLLVSAFTLALLAAIKFVHVFVERDQAGIARRAC
jgi:hypothetical protein